MLQRRISFDSFFQDIRFALRTLGRSKAWTTVAVLTLGLGIGANTAVFSVANDLLLDPLKYPNAGRLVVVSRYNEKNHLETEPTFAQLDAWRNARSFDGVQGFGSKRQTMQIQSGDPSTAHVTMVASTFARFAGARVLVGRFILPDDEKASAPPVTVISEHVWRSRFGGVSDIVGKSLKLEDRQYTIVGVLPDGVRIPSYYQEPVDVWIPIPVTGFPGGPVIGRLTESATIASAQQELRAIAQSLDIAESDISGTRFDINLRAPGSSGQNRSSVFMLTGAVCLLLLIACANVAHLLLARGAARERELSIRAALGAGRSRIVRQLMTESLILSSAGCVVGLLIGRWSLQGMIALRPAGMEELGAARIDLRVLLVTIALSVLSGVAFGLIAGLSGRGNGNFEVLRSTVATTTDRTKSSLRSLLVISENALSVVLLIGAFLLIRSVTEWYHVDMGFDATEVYAMTMDLPEVRYSSAAARQQYADQLLDEAQHVPGVQTATIANNVPGRVGAMIGNWMLEGANPVATDGGFGFTATNTVRPEYFSTMRMRLQSGHTFDEHSAANHEVVVSASMARQLWSDTNVVGRRLRLADGPGGNQPVVWNVVIGVAPDATLLSLMDRGSTPGIYFPMSKAPDRHLTLIVRMQKGEAPAANFRRVFLSIDRSISPPEMVSVKELLRRSVGALRFLMALLALFAFLAVTLSAIGLYGVITYMVSQSTREIGVRVALGATRRDVIQLVIRKGVTLSVFGLVLGLVGAVWGARLLSHEVGGGIIITDPLPYVAGSALLLLVGFAACVAPTIRATRIDPMLAMRSE